ncbi:MAG: OB-fold nucleic acid binding domain-containing protein [Candidatus ainarchaeum sp.]|nr:OB-fold nucleic acid binding domain-containing protein [Candidatus ainarchaeum sp.]MDD3976423.1 OB-fold nucleic acid binding domain-containing protein [Candidatus ainarchaeum sp.]
MKVNGWINTLRLLGKIGFIELRDISGKIQLVIINKELITKIKDLTPESCISAKGTLQKKQDDANKFELLVNDITIHSIAKEMPFSNTNINNINPSEEITQKYREIYLRTEKVQNIFLVRSNITKIIKNYFYNLGFLDIETPILGKSTPEGARDYLVPSRVNPGKFYALPQSPQIYKQILMASGIHRYFQIAKCFRDEDLRAERQPEFTQIDLEMSFVNEEDVMNVTENLLKSIWKEIKGKELNYSFPRIEYSEAMFKYGSDKPDLRYGLEFKRTNDIVYFETENILEVANYLKEQNKVKYKENGQKLTVYIDRPKSEHKYTPYIILGNARTDIAKILKLNTGEDKFLWVINFPMFEYSETENRFMSMHHPFTQPINIEAPLEEMKSRAYDIVLNGVELGGGSIRIHDYEMQQKIFKLLKLSDKEIDCNFGFFLDMFKRGLPPHGGLAIGLDRLVMLIVNTESIREVIAFPKTKNAEGLLENSPSIISDKNLSELGLSLKKDTELY